MSLLEEINEVIKKAFLDCGYEAEGKLVKISDRPDLCQFQCNSAFEKAKEIRKNPREVAGEIIEKIKDNKIFKEVSVAGPGFINLSIDDSYLKEHVESNFSSFNISNYNPKKERIIIDYGGPNVAKPLHVGHLRPAIIGESLKRLARELGNDVIGDVHLGDWGRQMGMIISEIKYRMPDLVYFDPDYEGEYPEESPVTVDELNEIYPKSPNEKFEQILNYFRNRISQYQDNNPQVMDDNRNIEIK